jgi:hypothetical protein
MINSQPVTTACEKSENYLDHIFTRALYKCKEPIYKFFAWHLTQHTVTYNLILKS